MFELKRSLYFEIDITDNQIDQIDDVRKKWNDIVTR